MSAHPLVSVIIPTYNRSAMLRDTVASFLQQDYPPDRLELIIADNNSTDDTRAVAQEIIARHPLVRYFFEPRQGVHYARNGAAKVATGEILYFTDDDMLADRELLTQLVRVFELFPEVGCASGLILPAFQKKPPNWVIRCLWNGYLSVTDRSRHDDLIVARNIDLVYSCHQAIRRAVFFKAGGFNPENTAGVWIGDGETGLNRKILAQGVYFAYSCRSVIRHVIPPGRMTLQYLINRIGNQAYCDAYTEYRSHRKTERIMPLMIRRNTLGAARIFARSVLDILLRTESWHFIPARFRYLLNRTRYDLRLLRDPEFRALVEIDDWLSEDTC